MMEVFAVVAAAAVALLLFVFLTGLGRRGRLRSFVRQREGEFSRHDIFGIADRLDPLLDDKPWVGLAGELPHNGSDLWLFDLHDRAEGPPRHTAALVASPDLDPGFDLILRESLPDGSKSRADALSERYDLDGANWEELPETFCEALHELPRPGGAPGRDWLLEVRILAPVLYVASRDRPLSFGDEWRTLVETADVLHSALERTA